MVGTGGGPPFLFPPTDFPDIEEKILNIITPVAISGNNNISETEVSFETDIINISNVDKTVQNENSPDPIISFASGIANTSPFVSIFFC